VDGNQLNVDNGLVDAIIRSTNAGLQMAGVKPAAVGISRLPARAQEVAVVIGLVGRRNGTVTLNISQRATLFVANKFTGSSVAEVDEEVFDAVGEITNIIAGRLKAELSTDEYQISNISCPSIVMGGDYRVHHFRGFNTVAVEFELKEISTVFVKERIFSTTVSLSQS
jgi:CheY-specific phosphatase CheX